MKPPVSLFASLCVLCALCGGRLFAAIPGVSGWRHEELRRFKAMEANQGVAVDTEFFYAIDNHAIGKYRKDTGVRVAGWDGGKDGRIKHLNAGVVFNGRLYCAHSNFPKLPEQSSVETWDTATMQPVGQHRLEQPPGSLTWALPIRGKGDRSVPFTGAGGGEWLACFAHYKSTSDPARTVVQRFDAGWKQLGSWSFSAELIQRFAGSSASGGGFGPGGRLFVTGHDAKELYLLGFPTTGTVLEWQATIPISAEGQAFCWDPVETNVLYSISRRAKEVIVSRVTQNAAAPRSEAKLATVTAETAALSAEEQRLGFEALFDGQSFTGWEQKGNWVIADGAFHRKDKGGDLTWKVKQIPDDFELRFEWKVSKGCNSGVYYRPAQYEYQVLDNVNSPYGENPRQAAASLFFCMAPSKDATRALGEWNEGRVMGKGTVIQHWLNGEAVIDFDYTDPKWAKEIELLRIRGANLTARGAFLKLQDHGADVWFRNLRLRTIPPEEKLARFPFTPMPVPSAALEKENERVRQMLKAKEKK